MKTLSFSFKSSLGKTTSIRLNKYEADVTADQAKQFAQIVADAKAFVKDGVNLYATPTGAKMTETQVTEIYHVDEKKEPQPAEPHA